MILDGDAYAPVTNLRENGTLPRLAQSPTGGFREPANLAPQRKGHDPVIVEFAQASALPTAADLFEDGHGGS
jgi:hypothetical protein